MALNFDLTDKDFEFNAALDPMLALEKMGFLPRSIYREGNLIRVHCPVHKDLVRKSLIIDATERTFKCQFSRCQAHDGGLMIELIALYYQCMPGEVSGKLFAQERSGKDLIFRGEMFINQGRAREALPYFEQAISQNPRDEISRCKLAALYLELGMKDDAYQEYLRAAESYAVRGELEKTLSIYNILIMLQPGAVKARKQLAFLFSRLGRPDAAAEHLKWVIDFYCHYGQAKGAIEACEQMLEADPENPTARRILGRLYQQTGQRVQGVQEFEQSVRLYIAKGEREEALETLEEAIGVAPGNPRLRELKGQAEALAPTEKAGVSQEESVAAEQAFHRWLADVDEKLDIAMDGVLGEAKEPAGAGAAGAMPGAMAGAGPAPTPEAGEPGFGEGVAEGAAGGPEAAAEPGEPEGQAGGVTGPQVAGVSGGVSAVPEPPSPDAIAEGRAGVGGVDAGGARVPPEAPPGVGAARVSGEAPPEVPPGVLPKGPAAPSAPPRPVPSVRLAPPVVPGTPAGEGVAAGPSAVPGAPVPPFSPLPPGAPVRKGGARSPLETAEIAPDDHRIAMCLADLKDLSRDQVEQMREQLIMMFNEARRNYEEGLVADWELRSIKEFYKAFNIAVDRHLHGGAGPAPSSSA